MTFRGRDGVIAAWTTFCWIAVVLAVVVPLILVRAYAQVSDEQLAEWARAHGLELAPENQPMVAHYLRKARVLRTWGALSGLLLPSVVELALSRPPAAPGLRERWLGGAVRGADWSLHRLPRGRSVR